MYVLGNEDTLIHLGISNYSTYNLPKNKPIIIIAHSDNLRWFGSKENLEEWDLLIKTFNNLNMQQLNM